MDFANAGQQLLQGGLLDSISRFVGGNPETTKRTLNAALPTAMYTIADHGSTEIGAAGLLDGLKSGQAPQLDVSDLGRTLDDPHASEQLLKGSGGFLEKMLGGKLSGLVSALSSFGGGDHGMASKLLGLAAPLALGVIGRRVREGGLDARGLAGFLGEQKTQVASMVPGPLRQAIGLPAAPPAQVPEARGRQVERAERIAPRVAPPPPAPRPARANWPILVAALAALFGLGWLVARTFRKPPPPSVPAKTVEKTPAPANPAPTATPSPPKSAIADYLAGGQTAPQRFTLEGVSFATGDSRLSADAQRSVNQLAATLKAHPDASLRIEGATDGTGNAPANVQLGQARADAVADALVADGVARARIATGSVGPERPAATNAKEEGPVQNGVEIVLIPR
jgi:outer membrane protein OmpA-like peptidoglycan-associated protein